MEKKQNGKNKILGYLGNIPPMIAQAMAPPNADQNSNEADAGLL